MRVRLLLVLSALCLLGGGITLCVSDDGDQDEEDAEQPFHIHGDAAKGRVIYRQLCMSCHGERGDGQGPAGKELSVKLPDFTDAEFMFSEEDEVLFTTVKEGGAAVGKSGIMHSWKSNLNDQQIHDVLSYVRSFASSPMADAPEPRRG